RNFVEEIGHVMYSKKPLEYNEAVSCGQIQQHFPTVPLGMNREHRREEAEFLLGPRSGRYAPGLRRAATRHWASLPGATKQPDGRSVPNATAAPLSSSARTHHLRTRYSAWAQKNGRDS